MKRHRSGFRRFVVFVVLAAVVISILGFFVAPPIVKSQLVKRLTVELGRPVRIETVRLNPWILSAAIEGMAVSDRDNGPFVAWDRVYVNFDVLSFFVKEWRFQEITAVGPAGRVIVNKDGTLNFSDLLEKFGAKPAPAAEPKPAWPLRVAKLVVIGAQLDFADHSRSLEFQTHVGPVTLTLLNFHTSPNRNAPYQFTAETESGEKLRWLGTVSINPLSSQGELEVNGVQLAKYAPYYRDFVRFDVTGGVLNVSGKYRAGLDAGKPAGTLDGGNVHVTGFKVAPRGSTASTLELDDLEIAGIEANATTLAVKASKIALLGGRAAVHRTADGVIDLLAMLEPAAPPSPAPATSAPASTAAAPLAKPQVDVANVSVRQFSATFDDQATPRHAVNTIENLTLDLQNVTLREGAAIPMKAAVSLAKGGLVNLEGSVGLSPIKTDLTVDVSSVLLASVSPYIEPMLNVRITSGAVSTKGTASIGLPAGQPMQLAYSGDLNVDRFGMVDGVANEPFAGWTQLSVNGIELKGMPLELAVKEIAWTDPSAHIVMNQDHTLNLAAVLKTPADGSGKTDTPPANVPSAAPAAPLPKISVGQIRINNGEFTFLDRSVQPEVSTGISKFGGTITGLSSENLARADVDLKASVDGSGPVAITGKLDPLGASKSVDLKVDFKDVELTPFSPYSAKFAGFELARGKLFLDVNAKVADQKVDMSNVVTLTHFTFGAPSQSPDATKLPVRLAVALLKDTEGKILLDVPVEGNLGDPNFRIGRVVMRVIGNLLTKVATSPFSLLGAMFGGGGEELAFQDFQPAEAELLPDDMKKLETLTKALTQRPGLSLEITGSFDPAADTYELQQRRFAQLIRARLWDERRALDAHTPPPEQLVITPADELSIVQKLFADKFPDAAALAAPPPSGPPPPMAAPKAAPEKKSFLRRATDVVTLKSWREGRSEKKPDQTKPAEPAAEAPAVQTFNGPPLDEMKARLSATVEVTKDDLRRLAARRAQRVRDYFAQHQIDGERLILANVPNEGKGARVFLQLQ